MITRGEFFMIKEMYERGMSISDIARELGIDRKTVHDRIRMVLHALDQLVPHPLDHKAKRSATTVVSRTFREQVLGKQIPDHKPVPSPFGSEAQQLAKDMDGDDDLVFLFQQMKISTLKRNLDTR
ncbi:hypothetical protein B4110_3693 [Parageobacillus toebii]|uniref:Uncharacterized protein n=1 Tax=Parageobacillus toebii TaxID=153151 RepID=A0A150N1D8_9BACL|nr:hypothetical protein B4110_3693 [Parageobacillus toebii]